MSYHWIVNYTYLVIDSVSKKSVIIDPAWQIEKIERALESANTFPELILITHAHPDHINLAKPLAEQYKCPIYMSVEEINVSGFRARQLVGIDSTPLLVGNMLIHPLLTPGHTSGSMCFNINDNLFTGDTLFIEGCGMCSDVQTASKLYMSIEYLKKQINPHTKIFPGHSYGKPPGQDFSFLLKNNIYLQFKNVNDFISYRLRKGQNHQKMFSFL